MSDFLKALDAAQDDTPVHCPLGIAMTDLRDDGEPFDGRLNSEEAEGLSAVLKSSVPDSASLMRLLRKQGVKPNGKRLGLKSVANHRNGSCSCRRRK